MAVKATAEITLRDQTDAEAIILWHYVSTSATKPNKPNTTSASATPSGWSKSEPSVSSDSDLSKYDYTSLQTVWGDGTCDWGDVNLSASYEAAKRAWNKAGSVENQLNNLEIGGRNLLLGSDKNTITGTGSVNKGGYGLSVKIPKGTTVVVSVQIDADDVSWANSGSRRLGFELNQATDGVASGTQYIGVWWGFSGTSNNGAGISYVSSETSFHGRIWATYTLTRDFDSYEVQPNRWGIYIQNLSGGTVTVSKPKVEIGNKATDWSPAPEDVAASAVKRTQRIWYRKSAEGAPATPGAASSNWVVKADDGSNAWTKMHISISSTEKFIYTCEQYEMGDGTVGYTSVLLDNTINVIDGGKIITGSVSANAVNAASGTFAEANIPNLSASKITTGTIAIGRIPDAAKNENVVVGGRNLLPISIWKWKESGTITNAGITITEESDGWFRVSGSRTGSSSSNCGLWGDSDYSTPAVPLLSGLTGKELTYSVEVEGTPFVSGTTYANSTHIVFYGTSSGTSKRLGGFASLSTSFTASADHDICAEIRYYIGSDVPAGSSINGRFRIKAEFGNKATDWSPAPEDVTYDINTVSTAMSEANEGLADSIAEVSRSLEDTNTRLIDLTQAVRDADADRAKWIRADDRGLTIGAVDSDYNLVLDNNSVDFKIGDQLAATASVDAFIPTALRLGDYVFSGSGGYLYIDYQPLQTQ